MTNAIAAGLPSYLIELKTKTDSATVQLERAKQIPPRIVWAMCLPLAWRLWTFNRTFRWANRFLGIEADFDTQDQLRAVAHHTGLIQGKVGKMITDFRELGICDLRPFRGLIADLEANNDYLASIREGYFLSADASFSSIIRDTAEEASSSVREIPDCQSVR